ncbi:aspartate--ammonia ligase [Paenibacillus physcomitrellae]|uniref:Aspartate--ammonia ligase n=1 Tax=Paenibacillus physcomitrellae TaxID=1619311 RepID=A0ABQ1FTH4_9BACL|nr:aspartate--ammonia ligase [Paenibacillus physcomitrellae]GGA29091.1 aspartate--ammonia ligase [Paenibacillus physcomitrellae]
MLRSTVIPRRYESKLNLLETEQAITEVKTFFQTQLENKLRLMKVSSPIMLKAGNGVNDNLNGTERIVSFDALDLEDGQIEMVQSLAKWKRMALARYGFTYGEGLYTDMRAVRRDEVMDNLHSVYVDQWDWEKVIFDGKRTLETLQLEARKIYRAVKETEQYICRQFTCLEPILPDSLYFVTTQELEDQYPNLSPQERENEVAQLHGAVFIMQIGGRLKSGQVHDGRSPDYDDWFLNGDLVLWNPVLERAFEVSSMGIRVDAETLKRQLKLSNCENRSSLFFHQAVLNGELPASIGGGIGQSRLCMFLLKKAHIGEVQVSVWNQKTREECREGNIRLM